MKIFLTGASSGIGRATAEALSSVGHEVWGTSRDISRVPALPRMHAVRLDLSDRASIHDAFASASAEAGSFDVVINNAGSGHFGPAELLSAETLHEQFQTLVFAHIELCRLALASMRARNGSGLIINVTSLSRAIAGAVHGCLQRRESSHGIVHDVAAARARRHEHPDHRFAAGRYRDRLQRCRP